MKLREYEIRAFSKPVTALADEPRMAADELKAWFDSNSVHEVKPSVNGIIGVLDSPQGADAIGFSGGWETVGDALRELAQRTGQAQSQQTEILNTMQQVWQAAAQAQQSAQIAQLHAQRAQEIAEKMNWTELIDPVSGEKRGIQEILYEMFYFFGAHEQITCQVWDDANFTCAQMDALDFTCREFDLENIFKAA